MKLAEDLTPRLDIDYKPTHNIRTSFHHDLAIRELECVSEMSEWRNIPQEDVFINFTCPVIGGVFLRRCVYKKQPKINHINRR